MEPELAEIENAIKSLALADKDSVKEMAAKTTELAAKLDAIRAFRNHIWRLTSTNVDMIWLFQ